MIILGILIPLYALGSITLKELTKENELNKFVESSKVEDNKKLEDKIEKYNEKISKTGVDYLDPFTNEDEDYKREYEIYKNDPDKVFAYLRIPALDLIMPIYLDASVEHLSKGASHIDGTKLPGYGEGRTVIAGHRGYYKDLMFYDLDKLENGDKIFVDRAGKSLEYEVDGREIIFPYEWEKLAPEKGKEILTLLTCEPKRPPRPQRLLVNAKRVKKDEHAVEMEEKKEEKVVSKVKGTKYFVFGATAGLILFFFRNIFKFIMYLKGGGKNDKKF